MLVRLTVLLARVVEGPFWCAELARLGEGTVSGKSRKQNSARAIFRWIDCAPMQSASPGRRALQGEGRGVAALPRLPRRGLAVGKGLGGGRSCLGPSQEMVGRFGLAMGRGSISTT